MPNATAVTIKLESHNDSLQLVVADNGVGIPDRKVSDRRSLGLLGMKERAAPIWRRGHDPGSSRKGHDRHRFVCHGAEPESMEGPHVKSSGG